MVICVLHSDMGVTLRYGCYIMAGALLFLACAIKQMVGVLHDYRGVTLLYGCYIMTGVLVFLACAK